MSSSDFVQFGPLCNLDCTEGTLHVFDGTFDVFDYIFDGLNEIFEGFVEDQEYLFCD